MRLHPGYACMLLVAFTTSVAAAGDGFIGVYSDSSGTQSCTNVPQYTGTTLWLVGKLDGTTANGIAGAEFRVEVTDPDGWYFSYTPPANSIAIGNPLDTDTDEDTSGLSIAFSDCKNGEQVSLGTISVFN